MSSNEPRIVEQDGNIVRIIAGPMEAIAAMHRVGDTLILDRFSMDGAGPGSVVASTLLRLARRHFSNSWNHTHHGGNPGRLPRQIVIHI
jgi:hypothetical protein